MGFLFSALMLVDFLAVDLMLGRPAPISPVCTRPGSAAVPPGQLPWATPARCAAPPPACRRPPPLSPRSVRGRDPPPYHPASCPGAHPACAQARRASCPASLPLCSPPAASFARCLPSQRSLETALERLRSSSQNRSISSHTSRPPPTP